MTYLIWRQHRSQFIFATSGLAILTGILVISGIHASHTYSSASHSCLALGTCDELQSIFRNFGPLFDLIGVSAVIPCLLGLFWGVPVVAREVEQGTHQFLWTQTVTRRRWLGVKVAWVLIAAVGGGAALGALVMWWSTPVNRVFHYRFELGHFDTQGIVPVGYAAFAVALGLTVGTVIRRVLPALAVTLGIFAAIRFGIDYGLRPHYQRALTASAPLGAPPAAGSGSYWTIATKTLDPAGHAISGLRIKLGQLPAACESLVNRGQIGHGEVIRCLGDQGYRTVISYQPASRFWTFQGIETGIYLLLAAILVVVAFTIVKRQDA